MSKNNKGGKPGLNVRRKNALKLLEEQLKMFSAAGEDKPSRSVTRNGKLVTKKARPFEQEVNRMKKEIEILKHLIH